MNSIIMPPPEISLSFDMLQKQLNEQLTEIAQNIYDTVEAPSKILHEQMERIQKDFSTAFAPIIKENQNEIDVMLSVIQSLNSLTIQINQYFQSISDPQIKNIITDLSDPDLIVALKNYQMHSTESATLPQEPLRSVCVDITGTITVLPALPIDIIKNKIEDFSIDTAQCLQNLCSNIINTISDNPGVVTSILITDATNTSVVEIKYLCYVLLNILIPLILFYKTPDKN